MILVSLYIFHHDYNYNALRFICSWSTLCVINITIFIRPTIRHYLIIFVIDYTAKDALHIGFMVLLYNNTWIEVLAAHSCAKTRHTCYDLLLYYICIKFSNSGFEMYFDFFAEFMTRIFSGSPEASFDCFSGVLVHAVCKFTLLANGISCRNVDSKRRDVSDFVG